MFFVVAVVLVGVVTAAVAAVLIDVVVRYSC